MPVPLDALRALGARRVTLRTAHGRFTGSVAQAKIADTALIILFAVDGEDDVPLVVAVDSIEQIEER